MSTITIESKSSDLADAVSVDANEATSGRTIDGGEGAAEGEEFEESEKQLTSDVVEPNTFNLRPMLEDR